MNCTNKCYYPAGLLSGVLYKRQYCLQSLQDCSNIDVIIIALFEYYKHCTVGYCVAFGYRD